MAVGKLGTRCVSRISHPHFSTKKSLKIIDFPFLHVFLNYYSCKVLRAAPPPHSPPTLSTCTFITWWSQLCGLHSLCFILQFSHLCQYFWIMASLMKVFILQHAVNKTKNTQNGKVGYILFNFTTIKEFIIKAIWHLTRWNQRLNSVK